MVYNLWDMQLSGYLRQARLLDLYLYHATRGFFHLFWFIWIQDWKLCSLHLGVSQEQVLHTVVNTMLHFYWCRCNELPIQLSNRTDIISCATAGENIRPQECNICGKCVNKEQIAKSAQERWRKACRNQAELDHGPFPPALRSQLSINRKRSNQYILGDLVRETLTKMVELGGADGLKEIKKIVPTHEFVWSLANIICSIFKELFLSDST